MEEGTIIFNRVRGGAYTVSTDCWSGRMEFAGWVIKRQGWNRIVWDARRGASDIKGPYNNGFRSRNDAARALIHSDNAGRQA